MCRADNKAAQKSALGGTTQIADAFPDTYDPGCVEQGLYHRKNFLDAIEQWRTSEIGSGDAGRYSRSFGLSAPFASPPLWRVYSLPRYRGDRPKLGNCRLNVFAVLRTSRMRG
jgi:hypothetical protein